MRRCPWPLSVTLPPPSSTTFGPLALRTFAVAAGRIHLWVGGGIVWDSDPAAEIEESWVKARPLLRAIGAPMQEVLQR